MYPKKIKLDSEKLKKLLIAKGELIDEGRKKSEIIEIQEKQLEDIDKEIQGLEAKVDIKDLLDREKEQTKIVEECIEKMKAIKQEIFDRMKSQISQEVYDKYETLNKAKEDNEEERNKIAMKAQKYNDKIIPLTRKLVKPLLDNKYEDYETIKIEDGEIVATIFSHLNDFEVNFDKKNAV